MVIKFWLANGSCFLLGYVITVLLWQVYFQECRKLSRKIMASQGRGVYVTLIPYKNCPPLFLIWMNSFVPSHFASEVLLLVDISLDNSKWPQRGFKWPCSLVPLNPIIGQIVIMSNSTPPGGMLVHQGVGSITSHCSRKEPTFREEHRLDSGEWLKSILIVGL